MAVQYRRGNSLAMLPCDQRHSLRWAQRAARHGSVLAMVCSSAVFRVLFSLSTACLWLFRAQYCDCDCYCYCIVCWLDYRSVQENLRHIALMSGTSPSIGDGERSRRALYWLRRAANTKNCANSINAPVLNAPVADVDGNGSSSTTTDACDAEIDNEDADIGDGNNSNTHDSGISRGFEPGFFELSNAFAIHRFDCVCVCV